MSDDWLQIPDKDINVEEVMQQIRERIARRSSASPPEEVESPTAIAETLWKETIADPDDEFAFGRRVSIRRRDCDVVPRYYEINWRIPILGPIHAVVRRVINAEIRRYLLPSLEKQSRFNRKVLQVLKDLTQENARLHREIEELRGAQE